MSRQLQSQAIARIPILRLNKVIDPNDVIFRAGSLVVSRTSDGQMLFSVGRNHAKLSAERANEIAESVIGELRKDATEVQWAAIAFRGPEIS